MIITRTPFRVTLGGGGTDFRHRCLSEHRVFHEVCQCDRFAAICHLQAGISERDLLCPYLGEPP